MSTSVKLENFALKAFAKCPRSHAAGQQLFSVSSHDYVTMTKVTNLEPRSGSPSWSPSTLGPPQLGRLWMVFVKVERPRGSRFRQSDLDSSAGVGCLEAISTQILGLLLSQVSASRFR